MKSVHTIALSENETYIEVFAKPTSNGYKVKSNLPGGFIENYSPAYDNNP